MSIRKNTIFTILALFVLSTIFTASVEAQDAQPPSGLGIVPWLLPGPSNQGKNCADLDDDYADPGTTWLEFKFEENPADPAGGCKPAGGPLGITFSNCTTTEFDWTSIVGIDAIVVKDGEDGANFYVYDGWTDPPDGDPIWRDIEEMGDTGLSTPNFGDKAISHITFCYDVEPPPELDYGDAPDPLYCTLAASTGASHLVIPDAPFLGLGDNTDAPDIEADGQPDPLALGDDNAGTDPDDEDGVSIPLLQQGQPAAITFEVHDPVGRNAFVDGWIDFNGNGLWGDVPNEYVVSGSYSSGSYTTGVNAPPVTVPSDAVPGSTYARFRINSWRPLTPCGDPADNGEVEDHLVRIEESQTGDITAHKFNDLDGDGILVGGEPGLSGWTMTLHAGHGCCDEDGCVLAQTDTNGNGNVSFSDLVPGNYSVRETLKDGWENTTGVCQDVTLVAGGSETINFGNWQPPAGSITAHKFNDLNGNGVDDGEPGLEGWTMTLYSGPGCPSDADSIPGVTDSSGDVSFSDLAPGDYSVQETLIGGWENTTPLCQDVTLEPGGSQTINFGNRQPNTITAHKFEDLNGDGVLDAGELGLSGWEMTLHAGHGCCDEDGCVLAQTDTNGNGNVSFSDLASGDYSVQETLQSGWANTTPLCQNVTLAAGGSETVNFGNWQPPAGSITAHKFNDLNGDGILDGGEPGLEGWTMTLYWGSDCPEDTDNWPMDTDVSGNASFPGLAPGQYSVQETLQAGWSNTTPLCQDVTLEPGGSQTVNFGNQEPNITIRARKYEDLNQNAAKDPGEPYLEGWKMILSDASGTIQEGVTDVNGWFVFDQVLPGEYTVCEELQPGWVNTQAGYNSHVDPPCFTKTYTSDSPDWTLLFGNYKEPEGDVEITKMQRLDESDPWTDGLLTVNPGDTISYLITVESFFNVAVDLMIYDMLDALVEYVELSLVGGPGSGIYNSGDRRIEWEVDDYWPPDDGSLWFSFDVVIDNDAPLGSVINNLATVYYPDPIEPEIEKSDSVKAEVVPEPATLVLLGFGLLGIFALVRRRQRQRK